MYILKSSIKKKISDAGLKTSRSVYAKLDAEVEKILLSVIATAKADHRATVSAEHFDLSKAMRGLR